MSSGWRDFARALSRSRRDRQHDGVACERDDR
ncbi:MAG: excalibur calcium-binding domain-containing protein [Hyphomicrobiaceae bacterium]